MNSETPDTRAGQEGLSVQNLTRLILKLKMRRRRRGLKMRCGILFHTLEGPRCGTNLGELAHQYMRGLALARTTDTEIISYQKLSAL
jgi:hypothetical protein